MAITPPLPQRSPRIRRHNLHNYTSLVSTNGSYGVRVVLALPHLTPQPNMMKPHPNHQYYSAPPLHITLLWTNGHHPLSLNDPHVSGEDIIYTIIPALCQQVEAVMCIVVLALPHLTPPWYPVCVSIPSHFIYELAKAASTAPVPAVVKKWVKKSAKIGVTVKYTGWLHTVLVRRANYCTAGNFCWVQIFAIFADRPASAKI